MQINNAGGMQMAGRFEKLNSICSFLISWKSFIQFGFFQLRQMCAK